MREWTLLLGVCGLVGCADPIIGEWEARDNGCGRNKFEVDDELKGDGSLYLLGAFGECLKCDFDLTVESKGGGDYNAEVEFDTCACNGDSSFDADCELNDAGDELTCSIDSVCFPEDEEFDKEE